MPTRKVNNYSELFKAMNEITFVALSTLGDKIQDMWIQYTQERWYDKYDPILYERTFAIIKSIIKSDIQQIGNNKFKVDVYIDFNMMNSYHPNSQSILTGEETVDLVENVGHAFQGDTRDGTHAYESIIEWLRIDYERFLINELKTRGYTIK